jgi:hypothetical protein
MRVSRVVAVILVVLGAVGLLVFTGNLTVPGYSASAARPDVVPIPAHGARSLARSPTKAVLRGPSKVLKGTHATASSRGNLGMDET